mgnify:CR=1 FL=1
MSEEIKISGLQYKSTTVLFCKFERKLLIRPSSDLKVFHSRPWKKLPLKKLSPSYDIKNYFAVTKFVFCTCAMLGQKQRLEQNYFQWVWKCGPMRMALWLGITSKRIPMSLGIDIK